MAWFLHIIREYNIHQCIMFVTTGADLCAASSSHSATDDTSNVISESVPAFAESYIPNAPGKYQLKYNTLSNAAFLEYEDWLNESVVALHGIDMTTADTRIVKRSLVAKFSEELTRILFLKSEEWKRQREMGNLYEAARPVNEKQEIIIDTSKLSPSLNECTSKHCYILARYLLLSSQSSGNDVVRFGYLLVACVHLFSLVSEDHCNFALCMIKLIIDNCHGHANDAKPLSASIPNDTRTVIRHLDLDPRVRRYVSCPKCSCLYPYPTSDGHPPIPEHCTFRAVPNGPSCQESLRKEGATKSERFHQEFDCRDVLEWVAEVVCRNGNEPKLDRNPYSQDEVRRDIWDGEVLRTFRERGGQGLFVSDADKDRTSQGRYVFGFCWDGFNPFGNKQAGKKVTCGAMYLICYNFPIEERYLPENILLFGIIPGPNHHSKEQLNHFLRPLVDDLVTLWEQGMF